MTQRPDAKAVSPPASSAVERKNVKAIKTRSELRVFIYFSLIIHSAFLFMSIFDAHVHVLEVDNRDA